MDSIFLDTMEYGNTQYWSVRYEATEGETYDWLESYDNLK